MKTFPVTTRLTTEQVQQLVQACQVAGFETTSIAGILRTACQQFIQRTDPTIFTSIPSSEVQTITSILLNRKSSTQWSDQPLQSSTSTSTSTSTSLSQLLQINIDPTIKLLPSNYKDKARTIWKLISTGQLTIADQLNNPDKEIQLITALLLFESGLSATDQLTEFRSKINELLELYQPSYR